VTKILLVRHGHVEGIEPTRFRGRADLSLTSRGIAEAEQVARYISSEFRPAKVYTSPLRRCLDTGGAIAAACGIERVSIDSLSDIDYGEWQWKTYDEVQESDPEELAAWFATPHLVRFPGGEALQDIVARTADTLRLVLKEHLADTVVLVGHDSVNRALLLQLLDQPLSAYWRLAQGPCCINEIDVTSERIRVMRINDTRHLYSLGR
jgi:probable phosphoglycerate mutase